MVCEQLGHTSLRMNAHKYKYTNHLNNIKHVPNKYYNYEIIDNCIKIR